MLLHVLPDTYPVASPCPPHNDWGHLVKTYALETDWLVWRKLDSSWTLCEEPRSSEGLVTSSAGSFMDGDTWILKFIGGDSRSQSRQNGLYRWYDLLTKTDMFSGILLPGFREIKLRVQRLVPTKGAVIDGLVQNRLVQNRLVQNESVFKQCVETPGQSHSKERNRTPVSLDIKTKLETKSCWAMVV